MARVTLKNCSFVSALLLTNGELERAGRSLWEAYLVGPDAVRELWPVDRRTRRRLPNGWIVPELPPDAAGRKRPRLERHCGVMLIETHADENGKGSNKVTFCTVRAAPGPRTPPLDPARRTLDR